MFMFKGERSDTDYRVVSLADNSSINPHFGRIAIVYTACIVIRREITIATKSNLLEFYFSTHRKDS